MQSHSLTETDALARQFVVSLQSLPARATVVCLAGDLGAGKTTFTQAVARALGVGETVTSPTFVIEKIYKISHPQFKHLVHLDCYRLESGVELSHLGWSELLADRANLIMVEWPERVAEVLPNERLTLKFRFIDETTREIIFP